MQVMDERLIVEKIDQISRYVGYMQEQIASMTELAAEMQSQLNTLAFLISVNKMEEKQA